jgi:hypothetical protein
MTALADLESELAELDGKTLPAWRMSAARSGVAVVRDRLAFFERERERLVAAIKKAKEAAK